MSAVRKWQKKAARLVRIKFCADVDLLDFLLHLGFLLDANSCFAIIAIQVLASLEGLAKQINEAVMLEKHDNIIYSELHTNMRSRNATAESHDIFVRYYTNFRQQGQN